MGPIASTSGSRASVSGIASGLDTAALVDSLMQLERRPLLHLQGNRADVAEQQGLMRQFNTLLLELRDAGRSIDNRSFSGASASISEELLAYSTTSTSESVVTATASNGVTPGNVDVTVRQLATLGRQFSTVYTQAQATSALAAGQAITIDFPNTDPTDSNAPQSFTVTASSALSLDDVKDLINRNADNGGNVHAEVIREGAGDQLRLVLSAGDTGTSNDFTVSGAVAMDGTRTQLAQDASFSLFGGSNMTRTTNFVDDAMTGLSFELQGVSDPVDPALPGGALQSTTISVDVDVDAVAEKLDRFVKAYNGVMDFIEKQVKVNESTKRAGPLGNDSTLRQVQGQLSRLISNAYKFSGDPGNPFTGAGAGGSASGIGLKITDRTRLELDKSVLGTALQQDAEGVREFISGLDSAAGTGFDSGLASAFGNYLEPVVRSGDGVLATRDAGYASRLDGLDDSITRFEANLSSREETLKARFAQMELIVSKLQSQAGFLSKLR